MIRPRLLLWTAVAAYAAGFSALSVLRHRAFSTGRFDLGNMVQSVWSTAHGHPLQITGLRGDQVSRLGAHFDPILAAFAPLWLVWPSPDVLLVAQAVAVALGALPVYWLARKHLGSERAGVGFALAYLAYPPTQWLTLNEFHPVALACPLLLFAIWFLDEDRLLPFALCAAVAATTKEEIALVVAGLGVWYALAHHKRWTGAVIAAAGVAVALVAIEVVIPHFNRAGTSSFFTRYSQVGSTPGGIVHTALTDPWKIVTTAFTGRGLGYLAGSLLPLGGLALLAPLMLLAALPELAVNLLSAATTQTSIRFHYTAGLIPVLIAATVFGAKRIDAGACRSRAWWSCSASSRTTCSARCRSGATSRRQRDAGPRGRGDRARPHRGEGAAADPAARGRQCDELARRAPLGAAADPQLPVPAGRAVGGGRRDARRATPTGSRPCRPRSSSPGCGATRSGGSSSSATGS